MQVRSPALLPNIQKLAANDDRLAPFLSRLMIRQSRKSVTMEFGPAGDPLMILFFYPVDDKTLELACLFSPQSAEKPVALMRAGQLTLALLSKNVEASIVCHVGARSSPGYRMARLCGFQEVREAFGKIHMELKHEQSGQEPVGRSQQGKQKAGRAGQARTPGRAGSPAGQ